MHELLAFIGNILKLLVALLCGGLIGIKSENSIKMLGTPAHILIAAGSCLLMIVSGSQLFGDPLRTASHVAVGTGLLAAGVIIGERGSVSAIWTAASLWVAAISGVALGAGFFLEGASIALIAYFVLGFFRDSEKNNVP